jgi:hypothetical protein
MTVKFSIATKALLCSHRLETREDSVRKTVINKTGLSSRTNRSRLAFEERLEFQNWSRFKFKSIGLARLFQAELSIGCGGKKLRAHRAIRLPVELGLTVQSSELCAVTNHSLRR